MKCTSSSFSLLIHSLFLPLLLLATLLGCAELDIHSPAATSSESDSNVGTSSSTSGETDTESGSVTETHVDTATSETSETTSTGAETSTATASATDSGSVSDPSSDTESASHSDSASETPSDTSLDTTDLCNDTDPARCGSSCLNCVGSSAPICVDGACVECAEPGDCDAGQWCNASLHECALCGADDDLHCGGACASCEAPLPHCHEGACAECSDSLDCPEAGTYCDPSGTCAPCDVAAACGADCSDCLAESLTCASDGSACVACGPAAPCGDGAWCNSGDCEPCDEPGHCGPSCDACFGETPECFGGTTGHCGGCAVKEDCPAYAWCNDGTCTACAEEDPEHCGTACLTCTGEADLCDGGVCVECVDRDHCLPTQWCDGGICTDCALDDPTHCGLNCEVCAGSTPLCVAGACVECDGITGCDSGQWCSTGACASCDVTAHCGPACAACTGTTPSCGGSTAGCICNTTPAPRGSCGTGTYCDGAACATCNTASKCGASCAACSGSTPDCNGASCVCNATSCAAGTYCAPAGACAVCNTDDKCGASCATCSGSTPDCDGTKCVCDAASCPGGSYCTAAGTCATCNTTSHCGPDCESCTGTTPNCLPDTGCVCSDSSCGEWSYCTVGGSCASCDTDTKCGRYCTDCTLSSQFCDATTCVDCADDYDCANPAEYCNTGTHACEPCDGAEHCGAICEVCTAAEPTCTGQAGECVCTATPSDSCGGTTTWCNGSGACEACGSGSCGNGRCDCGETSGTCAGDCPNTCPAGYTHNATTNRCYKYVEADITWSAAKSACSGEGAYLADIASATENQAVSDVVPINSYFWFGLNDVPTTVSGDPTCPSPQAVDGTKGGTFSGATGSGTNSNADVCGYNTVDQGKNEYFSLTPTVSGTWTFKAYQTTSANYDIAIFVDKDCTLGNGVRDTDFWCTTNNGSCYIDSITVSLTAGTAYKVYLDSYNSYGAYALDIIPPGLTRAWRWDGGATFTSSSYASWYTDEPDFNSAPTTTCTATKSKYLTVRCGLGWKGNTGSAAQWFADECSNLQGYVCEKAP